MGKKFTPEKSYAIALRKRQRDAGVQMTHTIRKRKRSVMPDKNNRTCFSYGLLLANGGYYHSATIKPRYQIDRAFTTNGGCQVTRKHGPVDILFVKKHMSRDDADENVMNEHNKAVLLHGESKARHTEQGEKEFNDPGMPMPQDVRDRIHPYIDVDPAYLPEWYKMHASAT